MILPHGFRRLCLAKRPAEDGVNTEQRRFCSRAPRNVSSSRKEAYSAVIGAGI
jgi:hypothetical protein